jgi:hypothetical protein
MDKDNNALLKLIPFLEKLVDLNEDVDLTLETDFTCII